MKISKVEKIIDNQINEELICLKIKAVANIIKKLRELDNNNKLKNFEIVFDINEKSMRRDYAYNREESFNHCFGANLNINEQTHTSFKNELKEVFLFGMKYKTTDFYLDIFMKYQDLNENTLINDFVNKDFFDTEINGMNSMYEQIFNSIIKELNISKEDMGKYSYSRKENKNELTDQYKLPNNIEAIIESEKLKSMIGVISPNNSIKNKI